MTSHARNLFENLVAILKSRPEGMTEYQLLDELATRDIPGFADRPAGDTLNLFRRHFLLFHCLYRLRDMFIAKEQLWLEIHCLKIVLQPLAPERGATSPQKADPLRAYYLDMQNYEETDQAAVEDMLNGFWKRFHDEDHREDALKTLGLGSNACRITIKQRYRELARQHHPDHGGEAATFRQIADAASVLLNTT